MAEQLASPGRAAAGGLVGSHAGGGDGGGCGGCGIVDCGGGGDGGMHNRMGGGGGGSEGGGGGGGGGGSGGGGADVPPVGGIVSRVCPVPFAPSPVPSASARTNVCDGRSDRRRWARDDAAGSERDTTHSPRKVPRVHEGPLSGDALVRALMEEMDKSSLVWIADFGAEREALGATALPQLVGSYLEEGYGSMTQDTVRNRRYELAVQVAGRRAADVRAGAAALSGASRWLEIGPGAHAVLTQMVLRAGASVVSVEGNAGPAKSAAGWVKDCGDRARVLHGMSTDPRITEALRQHIAAHGAFEAIVHELLGFFAGSEANVHVWNELRASGVIRAGIASVPRRAGTFICPVLAEREDFNVCHSSPLYVVPGAFTLARFFRIGDAQGRSMGGGKEWRSRLFERLEFDGGADIPALQRCELDFVPDRPALVNGFVCWLWADAGDGVPGATRRMGRTGYPWGDLSVAPPGERALMFSSRANDGLDATGACCINWRNVFIPLPAVVRLAAGDRLTARTVAHLGGAQARYEFEFLLNGARVHALDMANPYPTFVQERGRCWDDSVQAKK